MAHKLRILALAALVVVSPLASAAKRHKGSRRGSGGAPAADGIRRSAGNPLDIGRDKDWRKQKPADADTAPVRVVLKENRCEPGDFYFGGNHCKILGRGKSAQLSSVRIPAYENNPDYGTGKVGGKYCYYLKEHINKGATPIPSDQHYGMRFQRMGVGGSEGATHWATATIKNGRKVLTATPVFTMDSTRIPPKRVIGTLKLHTHGQLPENIFWNVPTHGCLKLEPQCLQKFYEWSKEQGHPEFNVPIWES